MDLMLRPARSLKAIFLASCSATILVAIAIIAFGAPPIILVYVAWGGPILLSIVEVLSDLRQGRHRPPPLN
jgi:hypothetical protein